MPTSPWLTAILPLSLIHISLHDAAFYGSGGQSHISGAPDARPAPYPGSGPYFQGSGVACLKVVVLGAGVVGVTSAWYLAVSYTHLDVYKRQVDDCMHRIPNRSQMTLAATYRERLIPSAATPLIDPGRDKPTVIALREIGSGLVGLEVLNRGQA